MDDSKESRFPNGFLWGSATASYQVEGPEVENPNAAEPQSQKEHRDFHFGVKNNWNEAAEKGLVPAAGIACDSYNRYEEDFDIVKDLNQNAHRFSIEWARIEPEEGKFDEKEIEHYRKVLDALRERGIEPFVTLWHFTLPIWFAKMGGFENSQSPQIFGRYCEKVVSALARQNFASQNLGGQGDNRGVKYWITINEPNIFSSLGYLKGYWPPFKKNVFALIKIYKNLLMSHNVAYKKIKGINSSFQIGIANNMIDYQSNLNPINRLLSSFGDFFWNKYFLNKISESQDFIGVNYYHLKSYGKKIELEKTELYRVARTEYLNWEIYPEGIYNVLMRLKKYGKPVYITENGLADSKDERRERFIKDHLKWCHKAIQDGVDLQGYFYWSLLDNFEWAHGFGPRFGLVEINYDTMERKIRSSAYKYAEICKNNSL